MDNVIEFDSSIKHSNVKLSDVVEILPLWKTKIVEASHDDSIFRLKFLLAANTVEEIKEWQKAYEEKNFCSYSVKSTEKCSGRYLLFKQRLYCQRNTHSNRIWKPDEQNRTRNTNCPSAIQFTLRAVKHVYRGKNKALAPVRAMPCVVQLIATHNHPTNSPDALRFRQVSDTVKEKLIKLYEKGHAPASALEAIRKEIRETFEDYETKLADRKYCPDYSYCYHLYTSEFKRRYTPTNLNQDSKDFLLQHINQHFHGTNADSIRVAFPDESSYVICICPPFFKRTHEMVKSTSEVVVLDSSGTLDRDVGRIFILYGSHKCGGLPLGVIVISSRSASLLSMGFQLLKEMVGENLFGGSVDGPMVFLINDSSIEQAAVKTSWTNSHCLLHVFYILRIVWDWLLTATNKIEEKDRYRLFQDFKNIVYADSVKGCQANYENAKINAAKYGNYLEYLKQYWTRKELWTLSHRQNLLVNYKTDKFSEAGMWFVKEKIFDRTKSHSLIQMLDFISTKFVQYYEKQILDAAYNKLKNVFSSVLFKTPPAEVIDRIQTVAENICLVPSEKDNDLFYIVNTEVLICTCPRGSTQLCKHINWACCVLELPSYLQEIDSLSVRQELYKIATGKEPPVDWLALPPPAPALKPKNNRPNMEQEITIDEMQVAPDPEQLFKEGQKVLEDIFLQFQRMLLKDPLAVTRSLKVMQENAMKIETASAFSSACTNFGRDYLPNVGSVISEPTHRLILVDNKLVLEKVLQMDDHAA